MGSFQTVGMPPIVLKLVLAMYSISGMFMIRDMVGDTDNATKVELSWLSWCKNFIRKAWKVRFGSEQGYGEWANFIPIEVIAEFKAHKRHCIKGLARETSI